MRKLRELQQGAEYHVTARINRGEMVFSPREEKVLFIQVIKRAKKKYKFQIKNFCIMENHIHLLIKPGKDESLSRIMQWILSVFAMAWNRKHDISGHVWGQRFFSRIITGIVDLIGVFIYIDRNPVEAHIVERPWEWEYGGLWHHRNGIEDIVEKPEYIVSVFLPEHIQLA
ncbi:MAG: transposase [Spirochaetaceae bacterium]|jgi:putative transposase|nr:transposase [Spirochaetaceae bacterium]